MNLYTWGIHLNLASSRLLGSKREKQTMKTPWQKTLRRDTYFFNSCLLTVPEGGIGFLSSKFKCNEVSQSSRCTSLESTLKLKSSRSRWSLSVWSLQVQIKARRLCQLFIKPLTAASLSPPERQPRAYHRGWEYGLWEKSLLKQWARGLSFLQTANG